MELWAFLRGLKTSAELVQFILNFLKEAEVDTFFENTAKLHYATAKRVLTDATKAQTEAGRHREIRAGIGHLADAFTALEFAARKTALSTEVATLITAAYVKLDDLCLAGNWKKLALQEFDQYAERVARSRSTYVRPAGGNPMGYGPAGNAGYIAGPIFGPNRNNTWVDENQVKKELASMEPARQQIDAMAPDCPVDDLPATRQN